MIPLQPVALGLVVVALVASWGGWDLLPDPLGWALVLVGTRAVPVRRRGALLATSALALVVSAVVWPPGVVERVAETDPSLSWALSLPQLAYLLLLTDGLRYAAQQAGAPGRAGWFATTEALVLLAAVLPVLVFGADLDGLGPTAVLVADLGLLLTIVLGLANARATWAGGHPRPLPGRPRGDAPGPPGTPATGPPTGPDSDSGPKRPRAS